MGNWLDTTPGSKGLLLLSFCGLKWSGHSGAVVTSSGACCNDKSTGDEGRMKQFAHLAVKTAKDSGSLI